MKRIVAAIICSLVLASPSLAAQSVLLPESGNYVVRCQADETFNGGTLDPVTGTSHISLERVDVGNEVELERKEVDPTTGIAMFTVTIPVTPGSDAEVACFAFDRSGNRSVRSVDTKVIDFTAPGAPGML